MNPLEGALASVRHYRRSALALAASTALAALVLCGALAAGDSIRASLIDSMARRLGPVRFLLHQADRSFRADLEQRLAGNLPGTACASALYLAGTISAGDHRLPAARIIGIAAGSGASPLLAGAPAPGEVWLSPRDAVRLDAALGDELLCQIAKPGFLPNEAPMGGLEAETVALRLRISRISEAFPAGFSPRYDQRDSPQAIVNRDWLGSRLGWTGRANLLLIGGVPGGSTPDPRALQSALDQAWTLDDAGYRLEALAGTPDRWQLLSDRVFIEDALAAQVERLVPEPERAGVCTWFADQLGKAHYVFVGAGDTAFLPQQPDADGIVIADWLATSTGARVGDRISLDYRLPDSSGALSRKTAVFRVQAIVPVPESARARAMLPNYPGMAGSASCRDWDPGIPLDLSLLSDRDEAYWQRWGGTPQAYISLETARRLFDQPFGTLTAIRLDTADPAALSRRLAGAFPPSRAGFSLVDAQAEGMAASAGGVDFAGLFLGLNSLLMAAAAFLGLLILDLALRRRQDEFLLYRQLGWPFRRIAALVLLENLLVALPGALVGAGLGLAYDWLTIQGLNSLWPGVTNQQLRVFPSLGAPLLAVLAALALQAGVVLLRLRRDRPAAARPKAARLLRRHRPPAASPAASPRRALPWLLVCVLSLAAALALPPVQAATRSFGLVEAFFGAGFLVLLACLAGLHAALSADWLSRPRCSRPGLLARNLHWRRRRILGSAGLLSAGLFLVLGTGGYLPAPVDTGDPRSGGGGFPWLLEATRPFSRADLASLGAWRPVGVRVHDGDDASCLNIRRSVNPPLYGVPPAALRGRFALAGQPGADPWALLEGTPPDGSIPVLVDDTVLAWGLGKAVGDRIDCRTERGETVQLSVAGSLKDSIFQGGLLLSESQFRRLFPSESGYRLVLLGAAGDQAGRASLERQFRSHGLAMESSAERLARFAGVERGYLAIFLVLGSLALALGSLGFAIQVFRSVQEDAPEILLLRQLGWPERRLLIRIWLEPALTWLWGGAAGTAAARLALQGQAGRTDWALWWAMAGLILGAGALAIALSGRFSRPADQARASISR